ncbi:MAG: bifunctional phosphoglucose/phosphomannose isomerase [candidate division Zixibacteria bacterium]|jgi:glucose/mannose-6-phosphate isomerase|nr:bifunctional phosphoglucose/phosphomannose isomerase [candidate division Zixibacteria bacterium]
MQDNHWESKKLKLDPGKMYEDIFNFPDYLEEGTRIGQKAELPDLDVGSIRHVVVCGMGGSAIGADLVRSYLGDRLKIPMVICRHYGLPGFVGRNTLAIGSSYSGNTEETLTAIAEANKAGARIICVTTGGKLEAMAAENSWNCLKIPPGLMPRAALAYSFAPLLVLMSRMGFVPGCDNELEKAASATRKRSEKYSIESEGNAAMELANRIYGRIPIIYAAQDHFDAVALRFKGQVCENSKQLAFANVYPEFNHNELVGWELYEPFVDKLIVLTLKDIDDHLRVTARMRIVNSLFSKRKIEAIELSSDGDSLLSRMLSLIQLGDFASFYLAILNGVDPSPVKVIDYLKSALEKA